jgi:hypothetical protein
MKTTELKLRSEYPESLLQIIQSALSERLDNLNNGIKITQQRLQEFEIKYQLSTADFLDKFNNDQLQHSFDFDEWLGEAKMLTHLLESKQAIEGVEFVN